MEGWLAPLLLGLTMGMTACAPTCLPYLGVWVMGRGMGVRGALADALLFAGGKLLAYTLLGGGAAWLGGWLTHWLSGGVGGRLLALVSVLAAVWLLWPREAGGCHLPRGGRLPPFFLGVAMGVTPCAPLLALLGGSALTSAVWQGMGYGFLFGVGAVVTPLLVIVPLLGLLGQSLGGQRPWLGPLLRLGAAGVLLSLGLPPLLAGV